MVNNEIVPGFDGEKDDSLVIRLETPAGLDGCLILYLSGYIDTYNSNLFQKRVNRAIETGFARLIFHCSGLNYVSSTGIGSFTAFLKSVKPRGGDLVLLNIQPSIYEVFQLLGFSQFFNIKDNLEEALDYFRRGSLSVRYQTFPKVFSCPICSQKLRATRAGRFRCSRCKTILAIDNTARVTLG